MTENVLGVISSSDIWNGFRKSMKSILCTKNFDYDYGIILEDYQDTYNVSEHHARLQ